MTKIRECALFLINIIRMLPSAFRKDYGIPVSYIDFAKTDIANVVAIPPSSGDTKLAYSQAAKGERHWAIEETIQEKINSRTLKQRTRKLLLREHLDHKAYDDGHTSVCPPLEVMVDDILKTSGITSETQKQKLLNILDMSQITRWNLSDFNLIAKCRKLPIGTIMCLLTSQKRHAEDDRDWWQKKNVKAILAFCEKLPVDLRQSFFRAIFSQDNRQQAIALAKVLIAWAEENNPKTDKKKTKQKSKPSQNTKRKLRLISDLER